MGLQGRIRKQLFESDPGPKGHIHGHGNQTLGLDVDGTQQFNDNRINVGHCKDNTINQMWFQVQQPHAPPYEDCRASVVDKIHKLPELGVRAQVASGPAGLHQGR